MKRIGYLVILLVLLLLLGIVTFLFFFKDKNTAQSSPALLTKDTSSQANEDTELVIDLVSTLNQKISSLEQTVSSLSQHRSNNTHVNIRQYDLSAGQTTLDITGIPFSELVDIERNGITMLADEYAIVGNTLTLRDEAEASETIIIQYLT